MKHLKEFYGSYATYPNMGGRKLVYRDLQGDEKVELDKMAMQKFGRVFLDCGWEEQSTLRSLWFDSKDKDSVEKDIADDSEKEKERIARQSKEKADAKNAEDKKEGSK